MPGKFFGQYLVEQKAIFREDLFRALGLQEKVNLRFGDLVLKMGLMTEQQLARVLQAQRYEDLRFGDMAVKLGYLTSEQVDRALEKQRQNYLFIGEALVKLGVLTQEQLHSFLERYHREHKPQSGLAIEIPTGVPLQNFWEIVIDMNCKMLTRIAGLSYRLGPGRRADSCPQRHSTVEAGLTGGVNARLLITLSKKTRNQVAGKVLNPGNERSYPDAILNDALVRFFNLVCENIVNKAALLNHEVSMIPPRLYEGDERIVKGEAELGLQFPIHLPEGDAIEITIFAMEKVKCQA